MRDCGYALKKKGYTIKVFNIDDKTCSDCYNPLMYIRENPNANGYYDMQNPIQEDDVLDLINTLMANTKSENIQNTSRRSFLGESRNDIPTSPILLYFEALR